MKKQFIAIALCMAVCQVLTAQTDCLRETISNYSMMVLRPGDLLFYRDSSGMGAAVKETTGEYTHVALVESVDDTVWIIDATQKRGVSRRVLRRAIGDGNFPDIYRLRNSHNVDIDSVLKRARTFVGQPYDNAFMPDNGALYCSELIYECFIYEHGDNKGNHVFESRPMNWRDYNGDLPDYWVEHFKNLGQPVPEGVQGTNPTDLARSGLLEKVTYKQ